jgi:hypothetical protein
MFIVRDQNIVILMISKYRFDGKRKKIHKKIKSREIKQFYFIYF